MKLPWALAIFTGLLVGNANLYSQTAPVPGKAPAVQPAPINALQGVPAFAPQGQMIIMFRPVAPDMCGPGFYCINPCGVMYGPNYCVQPPFPPFNGLIPAPGCGQAGGRPSQFPGMSFPTHPFSRSPRDFFMVD